jgi:lysophospholipase L1-like esterase
MNKLFLAILRGHIILKLSFFLAIFFQSVFVYAQSDSLSVAREYRIRNGLPNFFQKLQAGQTVTIAYLGGSITAASDGWREHSASWLQKQYPLASIKSIDAGIGGTGSDFGVFRLRKQVLKLNPDLIFIEFAVNDGEMSPKLIHETMEGIVRQTWKYNSHIDICFVYTLAAPMLPALQKGRMPVSSRAMEDIAQHYGIPSVNMGMEVAALSLNGKLIFKGKLNEYPGKIVFSPDNVHPYAETGHRLYTEALSRSLQLIAHNRSNTKVMNKLVKPFTINNWEEAQMISVSDLRKTGSWKVVDDSVARLMPKTLSYLVQSTKPGSSIQVKFKGRMIGLFDIIGPGCGQYLVTLDNQEPKLFPRFDPYSTYYQPQPLLIPVSDSKQKVHTIIFKVSDVVLDKAAILQEINNKIDDPERYKENACYAGQLMLIGRLIQ